VKLPGPSKRSAAVFEERAARAELLAGASSSAAEPLRFAAGLLRTQAALAAALEGSHEARPLTGRLEEDLDRMLPRLLDVPRFAAGSGPAPLSEEARQRAAEDETTARTRLMVFWSEDRPAAEDYLSRAMLRPYVEVLRAHNVAPHRVHRQGRCPFCGGGPWISCRRGAAEGDGAARFLVCALCGLEYAFNRILCPSCFEEDPVRLPAFTSASHPFVRIEACETCSRYMKSLDLSQDARPLPEVDDLVSLSMDLWALEQGYSRIEPGLAGV
jgi:formate dehydrogenase maturation protein FdhE